MKKDGEILLYLNERRKGATQLQAAARAGISERSARKYEHLGDLPSQQKRLRTYRTRKNPFADDWSWIVGELTQDPALQAETIFTLLHEKSPAKYHGGQLRTLQRHIRAWRAQYGPPREIMFQQHHEPGSMAQSDFTSMNDLNVTIAGDPFPHLLFHLVLTYSNVEAISICFSESIEALAEGMESCLWAIGGVPTQHRTDNLSAAVIEISRDGQRHYTKHYTAVLEHYGIQPSTNTPGCSHQNGDVEQSHYRFKRAVDQALRVRKSRDFSDRSSYAKFLHDLVAKRNGTRQKRFAIEQAMLRPLPNQRLNFARETFARVTRFSTVQILGNTYSVPSRLIGETVKVRIHAETLEICQGTSLLMTLPRLRGKKRSKIDYRHMIWSLVRKPGAFAKYYYRDELFPTTTFRRAYDLLVATKPSQADREYLHILHYAASQSEREVETALSLILEQDASLNFDAIKSLITQSHAVEIPHMVKPEIDLGIYDQLLQGERHG